MAVIIEMGLPRIALEIGGAWSPHSQIDFHVLQLSPRHVRSTLVTSHMSDGLSIAGLRSSWKLVESEL